MISRVRERGSAALVEGLLPRLLAPATTSAQPETVAHVRAMMEDTGPDAAIAALPWHDLPGDRFVAVQARQHGQVFLQPDGVERHAHVAGQQRVQAPRIGPAEAFHREEHGNRQLRSPPGLPGLPPRVVLRLADGQRGGHRTEQ